MFSTERGKKIFFSIMFFSSVALLFPWVFSELYRDKYFLWVILPPYLPIVIALVLLFGNYKVKEGAWKIGFSVLTEILLIAMPIICLWQMMLWLYMNLKYENIVSNGSGVTFINWIIFALVCIPFFAFPILSRWKGKEVQ